MSSYITRDIITKHIKSENGYVVQLEIHRLVPQIQATSCGFGEDELKEVVDLVKPAASERVENYIENKKKHGRKQHSPRSSWGLKDVMPPTSISGPSLRVAYKFVSKPSSQTCLIPMTERLQHSPDGVPNYESMAVFPEKMLVYAYTLDEYKNVLKHKEQKANENMGCSEYFHNENAPSRSDKQSTLKQILKKGEKYRKRKQLKRLVPTSKGKMASDIDDNESNKIADSESPTVDILDVDCQPEENLASVSPKYGNDDHDELVNIEKFDTMEMGCSEMKRSNGNNTSNHFDDQMELKDDCFDDLENIQEKCPSSLLCILQLSAVDKHQDSGDNVSNTQYEVTDVKKSHVDIESGTSKSSSGDANSTHINSSLSNDSLKEGESHESRCTKRKKLVHKTTKKKRKLKLMKMTLSDSEDEVINKRSERISDALVRSTNDNKSSSLSAIEINENDGSSHRTKLSKPECSSNSDSSPTKKKNLKLMKMTLSDSEDEVINKRSETISEALVRSSNDNKSSSLSAIEINENDRSSHRTKLSKPECSSNSDSSPTFDRRHGFPSTSRNSNTTNQESHDVNRSVSTSPETNFSNNSARHLSITPVPENITSPQSSPDRVVSCENTSDVPPVGSEGQKVYLIDSPSPPIVCSVRTPSISPCSMGQSSSSGSPCLLRNLSTTSMSENEVCQLIDSATDEESFKDCEDVPGDVLEENSTDQNKHSWKENYETNSDSDLPKNVDSADNLPTIKPVRKKEKATIVVDDGTSDSLFSESKQVLNDDSNSSIEMPLIKDNSIYEISTSVSKNIVGSNPSRNNFKFKLRKGASFKPSQLSASGSVVTETLPSSTVTERDDVNVDGILVSDEDNSKYMSNKFCSKVNDKKQAIEIEDSPPACQPVLKSPLKKRCKALERRYSERFLDPEILTQVVKVEEEKDNTNSDRGVNEEESASMAAIYAQAQLDFEDLFHESCVQAAFEGENELMILETAEETTERHIAEIREPGDLSLVQLDYLIRKHLPSLKKIFLGKQSCERHDDYKKGGSARVNLSYQIPLSVYSDEQVDHIMEELVKVFCKRHNKYLDYVMKVTLPEILTLIAIDVYQLPRNETVKIITTLV